MFYGCNLWPGSLSWLWLFLFPPFTSVIASYPGWLPVLFQFPELYRHLCLYSFETFGVSHLLPAWTLIDRGIFPHAHLPFLHESTWVDISSCLPVCILHFVLDNRTLGNVVFEKPHFTGSLSATCGCVIEFQQCKQKCHVRLLVSS